MPISPFNALFPPTENTFGTMMRKDVWMQLASKRNLSMMLVGAFSLGLAGVALAAPGHHGESRFNKVDTDGDGVVSQEEFQAQRASRIDTVNVDGQPGLSFDEFVELREQRAKEHRKRRVERAFNRLDANDDGVVDDAELAARADKMFDRIDANDDGSLSKEEMMSHRWKRHHVAHHGHDRAMGYHGNAYQQVPPTPMP
jgi:Ca2+-binding EF-hand superfamily protein